LVSSEALRLERPSAALMTSAKTEATGVETLESVLRDVRVLKPEKMDLETCRMCWADNLRGTAGIAGAISRRVPVTWSA